MQGYGENTPGVRLRMLIYADDVLYAMAHRRGEVLRDAANAAATMCEKELGKLGQISESEKPESFLMPPNYGADSIHTRRPTHTSQETGLLGSQAEP